MQIPFADLKTQYSAIKNEIDAAVLQVLGDGQYVLGKPVADFETQFAAYCNAQHAIALNSGTSALHLCLLAAGIKPGDEVITVSMTFVATVAAILYVGAKPILIDVDPVTWNMDPNQLERAITARTKAIIPVHLHGLMADMDAIKKIANKHNLIIIEDACQAHGATCQGKRAGSIGAVNAFSFYPGKNLGAYGEGGGVVTNDIELARKVRMLRDFGQEKKYQHKFHAFNYRMETIQGAVLSVKLKYLEQWTEQRRQVAMWYLQRLNKTGIKLPSAPLDYRHVYHVFAVCVSERDRVQQELAQWGIVTNIHYPVPVHLQEGYADLGYQRGSLAVSEQLAEEFLSLPLYPEMTEVQVDYVCNKLQKVLQTAKAPLSL